MNRLRELAVVALILLSASVFTGCTALSYGTSGVVANYDNPQWAPPYYSGARYYYIPDIECYYDLSSREFIFLNNGVWYYSPNIPSMYAGFDLYNCFTIVLNVNVYRPWMHHQYYVSHYPRYYYHDYYDRSNIPYVRGFNENSRSALYWKENERHRARSWNDENVRDNRQFKYSKDDRQEQKNWNNRSSRKSQDESDRSQKDRYDQNERTRSTQQTDRSENRTRKQSGTTTQTNRNQSTNYYGKPIGNSVKVKKQMRNTPIRQSNDRGGRR